MIERKFPDLMSTYRGLTDELGYSKDIKPLKWGVCLGYDSLLSVEVDDLLKDDGMSLGMASYTKSRWTRFLRRYFRDDLATWIDGAVDKLLRYPSRPFVASYSVNLNTGHNYGGCLASLQISISPYPRVILMSRACHLDKVGFLDLALMNVVARRMNQKLKVNSVRGMWIASNCYISAISQIFYLKQFNMPTVGHRLERTMKRLTDVAYEDIKFGPLKRGRKRMMSLDEVGHIPNSILVKDLSIEPGKFYARGEKAVATTEEVMISTEDVEDYLEENGWD